MIKRVENSDAEKKIPFVFYLIMILIPILFFVLLETGLRIFNYGRNYEQFITSTSHKDMLYLNPEISNKYFEGDTFLDSKSMFKKIKNENSFRIFVIGESSVQGFPYHTNASFPSHLRRRLDLLYPDHEIEVINLGVSAISSFTILDLVPGVLQHKPDLIVIYTGHNEYYGALGAASTMSLGQNRGFVNFMIYLRGFKTMQLLRDGMSWIARQFKKTDEHTLLMEKMIGESSISLGSETYQRGLENFEDNLNEILVRITDAKVPVIIGTLSSNLKDHQPFVSGEKENNKSADDFFVEGRISLEQQRWSDAHAAFVKAKELDGLRFRAPEAINRIIEKLAVAYHVPQANIDSLFSAHAIGGVVGYELMCDHLHPNLKGYQLLGKGFYDVMQKNNFLPSGRPSLQVNADSTLLATFPYSRLDSLKAGHILKSLLSSYPFVKKGTAASASRYNPATDFVDQMSRGHNVDSARSIVAFHYFKENKLSEFSREINVLIECANFDDAPYFNTIGLLRNGNLLQQASPYIHAVLEKRKPNTSIYRMKGLISEELGDHALAIIEYKKAIALSPNNEHLYFDRGIAYEGIKNISAALNDYDKAIELNPGYADAYHNRGVLKFEHRNFDATIKDFDRVIALNPNNALAFLIRGYAKKESGDSQGACDDWKRSAELGSAEGQSLHKTNCK
jgi:tetratricopeptide (TPR) repeat protein